MNLVNVALVVGAGVVLVLVLLSERLSSWSLPAPLLAVVIGVAIGPHALDVLPFDRLAEYRDPLLTEAMTRAFAVADARAAAELDRAAAVIQTLLARTLSGGEPAPTDLHIAGLISDIWLANLVAFSGHRASAADTRDRIDRATRRLLSRAEETEVAKRYF